MKKKMGRPRKDPAKVMTEYIEVRCDAVEKAAFREAADAASMSMSVWIRDRLRTAARRELNALDTEFWFRRRAKLGR